MNPKDEFQTYKDLEDLIEEMNDYVDAAIVEGAHDKKTLEKMGFYKPVLKYSDSKLSDLEFIEMVAKKYCSVVILTDYDSAGNRFNKKLTTELEKRGVRVEKVFRRKIKEKLQGSGMRTIEAIYALKKRVFG